MKKRNFIYLILLLVYLGLVTWLCFGHFDGLPKVQKDFFGIPVDKVVHFLMFLPFPFLSFKTFDYLAKKPWQAVLASLVIFAVGCAIAAGTEIGQSKTAYRSGDPNDFLADILALGIASIVTLAISLACSRKH